MLKISYSATSDFWDWLTISSTFSEKDLGVLADTKGKKKSQQHVLVTKKSVLQGEPGIACVLKFCILHFPESIFRVHTCSIQQHSKDLFAHLVKINMFSICLELLNECPENMMQDEKLIWVLCETTNELIDFCWMST